MLHVKSEIVMAAHVDVVAQYGVDAVAPVPVTYELSVELYSKNSVEVELLFASMRMVAVVRPAAVRVGAPGVAASVRNTELVEYADVPPSFTAATRKLYSMFGYRLKVALVTPAAVVEVLPSAFANVSPIELVT